MTTTPGNDRSFSRWLLILAAVPGALPLAVILAHGVDMPYWDQWDRALAGLYIKAASGGLSLWDFTGQHNEHRVLVPRVLGFVVNLMTSWNTRVEMLLQWLIVCITSVLVLRLSRQTVGGGRIDGRVMFLWFLANVVLFTLKQYENWLWGMGLMNVMPLMFLTGAIALWYTNWAHWVRLTGAVALSAAAMFSIGSGVLVFPLMAVAIGWSANWKEFKSRWTSLGVLGGVFAACLAMYFYGFTRPPMAAGLEAKSLSLGDRLTYFLTFMGNQFAMVEGMKLEDAARVVGLVLTVVWLAVVGYFLHLVIQLRQMELGRRMLPWMLIGSFAVLNALMATVFRAVVGIENAVSSRYVTFTLCVPLALVHLIPMMAEDLRSRYPTAWGGRISLDGAWLRLPAMFATALVLLEAMAFVPILRACEMYGLGKLEAKAALLLINILPENPKLSRSVYPTVSLLWEEARELDRLGYLRPRLLTSADLNPLRSNRFSGEDPKTVGQLEQLLEISPGVISARGWALYADTLRPPDSVLLTYIDHRREPVIFAASDGIYPRTDLIAQRKSQRYEWSGWAINFAAQALPPDLKTVQIDAWAFDATTRTVRPLAGRMHLSKGPE